jgi:hypothetical protein
MHPDAAAAHGIPSAGDPMPADELAQREIMKKAVSLISRVEFIENSAVRAQAAMRDFDARLKAIEARRDLTGS